MSRLVQKDFKDFKDFICKYELRALNENEELWQIYKSAHSMLYGIMALISELDYIFDGRQTSEDDNKVDILDIEIDYLKECFSDLSSTIFISVHGAYKAARLMLRSSIEMFIRGMFSKEIPEIQTEKNLYRVFESIKKAPSIVKDEPYKNHFDEIHQIYAELCAHAHTASKLQMEEIYALSLFPKFETDNLKSLSSTFRNLVRDYIFMICHRFNKEFHTIHFENRQAILECLNRKEKPIIMGVAD